jgi:hypothetical protein
MCNLVQRKFVMGDANLVGLVEPLLRGVKPLPQFTSHFVTWANELNLVQLLAMEWKRVLEIKALHGPGSGFAPARKAIILECCGTKILSGFCHYRRNFS